MKAEQTLWVDQTDLLNWKGNLTGIQRTVYSLTINLARRQDVKFFYFDLTDKIFKECEPTLVLATKSNDNMLTNTVSSLPPATLRRIKRLIPSSIKQPIKKILHAATSNNHQKITQHPFKHDDRVLILGGNWGDDHRGFLDALEEAKSLYDLEVTHFIYDLIPVKYPNYFLPGSTVSFIDYVKSIASFTDHFICISESTKSDLREYLETERVSNKPNISTIRLGEDLPEEVESAIGKPIKDLITREFILCVGTIEARKNHALLYYVAKEASRQGKKLPQIIIAGKRGWMTGDIQHMIDNDPDTKGDCFIIDSPSDGELKWLYENCFFTIYPSMYEGWGLPLAEAANYGKLCLASNTSSMPEVIREYGDYFSPFNTQECMDKIEKYTDNPEYLKSKTDALNKRTRFTWLNSYENLCEILGLA